MTSLSISGHFTSYLCSIMKRLFFIFFSFLYLVSSAGVSFNVHYCGGKIKSISFFETDETNCCGTKRKNKNCCKEKTVVYTVKETQNGSSKLNITKASFEFFGTASATTLSKTVANHSIVSSFKDPPDIVYNNSYLLNRVFRI